MSPHKGARIYSDVGIRPPAGRSMKSATTLLIVRIDREINDWGLVLVPPVWSVSPMWRGREHRRRGSCHAQILNNQLLLPAEKFPDPNAPQRADFGWRPGACHPEPGPAAAEGAARRALH